MYFVSSPKTDSPYWIYKGEPFNSKNDFAGWSMNLDMAERACQFLNKDSADGFRDVHITGKVLKELKTIEPDEVVSEPQKMFGEGGIAIVPDMFTVRVWHDE